jgi:hypothetical protein
MVALPKVLGALLRQLAKRLGMNGHNFGVECGIVTFLKHGEAPDGPASRLPSTSACPARRSHPLDLPARGLAALVRASVHSCIVEPEVERFVRAGPKPVRTTLTRHSRESANPGQRFVSRPLFKPGQVLDLRLRGGDQVEVKVPRNLL